ncbi:MAG: T9SS type A sorting domain-containing protein, partial [Bacteroidota bacterium]
FAAAIGLNPNPADGYVNVTYNFEKAADLNIRLVNSLGQLLNVQTLDKAQNGSLRLDLSTLPAGAYNVVFSNGEQVATKRLIVE